MGLFSSLFGPKKPPYIKHASFENLIKSYKPKKGDKVKLWPKPNSSLVHAYLPKTGGGDGLIGKFNSSSIHRYLNNNDLKLECHVYHISGDFMAIRAKFDLYSKRK